MKDLPDLVYFPDDRPGITRRRCGRGFSYTAPDGTRIDDRTERARIAALAVPPAYEGVWISPRADGHLQATGRDARSRKQYRYHPDWTAFRAREKFAGLAAFGEALPGLRRRILDDLRSSEAGEREFAIAAVLALLDRAGLRIGNAGYARENRTYGATTLRRTHMTLDGDRLRLSFPAKGGRRVREELRDRTLNRVLTRLDDLPGRDLVSWVDDDGTPHSVRSDEVNAFLAERTGNADLTAKTFRTWNGSVAALEAAAAPGRVSIRAMAEAAAARLHNTPAIARTSYIHPEVIALADLSEADRLHRIATPEEPRGLRRSEAQLLGLLSK